MIKFEYTKEIDEYIELYEKYMLNAYKEKFKEYKKNFKKYGFSLEFGLFWKEYPYKKNLDEQKKVKRYKKRYECYVYCELRKENKKVAIKSDDGEADYYHLSCCEMIWYIQKYFLKRKIELIPYIDKDFEAELDNFLKYMQNQNSEFIYIDEE